MKIESIFKNHISETDKEFVYKLVDQRFSNLEIFIVGGAIRDILLGINPSEIDFCIKGNIEEFKKYIDTQKDIKKIKVSEFETYKLLFKDKIYDFSVTREESYIPKGSLPKIDKFNVSIEKDLFRRDFSINSIAININKINEDVIDPFNGYEDLKNSLIKINHEESFLDDPTRIFRAIKFSKRLNFKIDANTEKNLKGSIFNLKKLSAERIKNEIEKISYEKNCKNILIELRNLGALKYFYDFDPSDIKFNVKDISNWDILIFEIVKKDIQQSDTFFSNYNLEKKLKDKIKNMIFISNLNNKYGKNLIKKIHMNEFEILNKVKIEDIISFSYLDTKNYETINTVMSSLKSSKPLSNFIDIKKLKLCSDKEASNIFKILNYKKFKGQVISRKDEEEFINNF
tara:strand:- start:1777 stop:2976 length:1200 start_codon:yes stop_codon:yes gene_type:complete